MLSLASDPASGQVRLITRVGEQPSAFKSALARLAPGDEVRATGVAGDFLLPGGPDVSREIPGRGRQTRRPRLALVASGIGITPFLAHLARPLPGRDIVLVHGVHDAAELPLPSEVPGASRVVAVVPAGAPGCGPHGPVLRDGSALPSGWTWVDGSLEADGMLAAAAPGLSDRELMVSGPPRTVETVRRQARAAGVRRVRTDVFVGS
ncbi:ferredoxin--NADP reductase [Promicromonospora sp. NFX87]|uniref:ferredoxin--NADP reductase n=1 Tax=Promicromonospora sp. NFX87 TaxID=3402691 RepID=UPI003AFB349B